MPELLIAQEITVFYKSQNGQQQAAVPVALVVPQRDQFSELTREMKFSGLSAELPVAYCPCYMCFSNTEWGMDPHIHFRSHQVMTIRQYELWATDA